MSVQKVAASVVTLVALSSHLNAKYLRLPRSIALTLISLCLAGSLIILKSFNINHLELLNEILNTIEFSQAVLHGMLGFLLFASSLQIDVRQLKPFKTIIFLLATFSVAISTLLIGLGTWVMTQVLNFDLPLVLCFVFGALISPTDPVAVLGILQTLKAPKNLELKIAGEALFNDAMGMALFAALLSSARGVPFSYFSLLEDLLYQGLGAVVLGVVLGAITSRIINSFSHGFTLIVQTLALVIVGYTLAESVFLVSPVVTISVSGLWMGTKLRELNLPSRLKENLFEFWENMDEILKALLFVLIGLEILKVQCSGLVALASFAVIGIVLVARWISIALPFFALKLHHKLPIEVIHFLTWGGLRGGISIALALLIPAELPARHVVLAMTYFVVVFSIIVQGMTIGALVKSQAHRQN